MAKKLDPKAIEAARKKSSRAERRSQKKQIMQEDIVRNQGNGGVKIIPPPPIPVGENGERPKLRVAAYCRVSTQEEEQLGSFEMQVHHFQQRIESNPAWELVKIYKDEGRSGTTIHGRQGFQDMIADAVAGKIDLILTKSINRFGRNIVDILDNLRLLASISSPSIIPSVITVTTSGALSLSLMRQRLFSTYMIAFWRARRFPKSVCRWRNRVSSRPWVRNIGMMRPSGAF